MKRKTKLNQLLTWLLTLFLAAPPLAMGQDTGRSSQPAFTEEQVAQMVSPIALYPDDLLSQILMASTYPLEVVQASRWAKQNKDLKGDALAKALDQQPWDPSVKSLVNFPQVLDMMNEKLDWTTELGDAFLAQPKDVMGTVQKLRAKAEAEGNLKTTPEQKVVVEEETQTIIIQPVSPEVIYVPAYNPTVVYGAWPYPAAPPYPYYPPGYVAGAAAFSFAAGVAVGAAWGYAWGGANWHGGDVDIDVNRNANLNQNINRSQYANQMSARGQGGQGTWQHNPQHRQGVAYRDQGTSQRYGQSQARSAESRQASRGYGDRGASGSQGMQGGDLGSRGGSERGGMSSRESMGQSGSRGSMGGGDRGAFSGSGSGRSEQMASQRGSMSRGSSGGGFSGGGGGGGSRGGGGGGRGGGGGGRR